MNIRRVLFVFGRLHWRSGRMLAAVLLISLLLSTIVLASTAQNYAISWSTIDGGGGTSMGGSYALMGAIGQPDAGAMSGGEYTLAGGFWGSGAAQYRTFLPLVLRP